LKYARWQQSLTPNRYQIDAASLRSWRDFLASDLGDRAAILFPSTPHQSPRGFIARIHGSSSPKQKHSRAKSRQLAT